MMTENTSAPAPLWAILGFTALNSLGGGAITNGIFFITDAAYAFSRPQNYLMGVAFGIAYILGAALVGPLLRILDERFAALTARRLLIGLMVALSATTATPALTALLIGADLPPVWTIWLVVLLYAPLTGALWPIVESYLSGGRRGQSLRGAVGIFNVCWSAALVAALWGMGPLMRGSRAVDVLLALAAVHLLSLPLLIRFHSAPARHLTDAHEPHPPVYRQLLVVFRWLLPTSYAFVSTLGPYLPGALTAFGLADHWQTTFASTWMAARVAVFFAFERWHGWHGRWWVPVVGLAVLLLGFAACVLSPNAGSSGAIIMLIGLAGFGAAQGLIYLASLYYAMEVGSAEVEAGGMHESLIGVGYTVGPGLGLAVGLALSDSSPMFEPVLLGTIALLSLGVSGYAVRTVARSSKQNANIHTNSPAAETQTPP